MDMQEIEQMARQFDVNPGALACLAQFLADNIAKDPGAFVNANEEQRSQILLAGVKAWHRRSMAMLNELREGSSEWAQAARAQIAGQVYDQIRALHA